MDGPMQPSDPARISIRASDADRERVATLLRDNYSDGRLTLEEFQERLEKAYVGKTLGELDVLTADLPVSSRPVAPPVVSSGPERAARLRKVRDRVLTYAILMLFFIAIWAASGRHGSFWPIWPILIGGFILALDVLGLERPGRHGRRTRERRRRREERVDRRMDRRHDQLDDGE